ncbi:FtsX-like permease family protein [Streptomyces sp. NPDC048603]|uniref:FtsX-like permease family protein n=1 Tax=Streptomyces sp. NPDC048603 TaxID=3365577 RepID=UPI00371824EE
MSFRSSGPFRVNGLARAAVRFRPAAFVGTFVALLMTVAIVSACGILLETGARASLPPTRYADAPVVVAADQQVHLKVGSGEETDTDSQAVPDRARVDAALLGRLGRLPGVGRAVPDVVFPVRGAAGEQRAAGEQQAAGWGSTGFTGAALTAGRAPEPGEVVLGAGARVGAGAAGGSVTFDTPAGRREFRVVGQADRPGVWFADAEAAVLSGHPGAVDAIVLFPGSGAGAGAGTAARAGGLAGEARDALAGTGARVLTGDDRVLDGRLAAAREVLMGIGGSFGGVAAMVAVFTAAGTVALGVGQRSREFALLRAVGATPRQIRRTVATEALLVAPAAGLLGCLPGIALAHWWFGRLQDKGAVPREVELAIGWIPLTVAVGVGLLTALVAGRAAARRPARIRPGQALAAAAVERLRPGWVRTPLGLAALAGGIACSGLAASTTGEDSANAALGVVMLFMLAVALLGPLIARLCVALFGLPLRAAGPAGGLAAANSRTNARRLASAITPIVLAMAFSSTLLFLHTSEDRATREQQRVGLLADHVITGLTGLTDPTDPTGLTRVEGAADAPGVTAAVPITRAGLLVQVGSGMERRHELVPAQAFAGPPSALGRVQDLDVRQGSLDDVRPGTVAVDRTLADSAGVKRGDRLPIRLPDGTAATPTVAAVYARGLGFGRITLPVEDLRGHATSLFPTELLVKGGPVPDPSLGRVTDAKGWSTAQSTERELNAWANTTMAAVLGGFAAIAAANTLVMTVLDRRRELTMLRLVGSTRRQVLRMIRWEALLVTVAGITLGTAIALATLHPLTRAITGTGPYVPPALYGSMAAAVLALGLTATTVPARRVLGRG